MQALPLFDFEIRPDGHWSPVAPGRPACNELWDASQRCSLAHHRHVVVTLQRWWAEVSQEARAVVWKPEGCWFDPRALPPS